MKMKLNVDVKCALQIDNEALKKSIRGFHHLTMMTRY